MGIWKPLLSAAILMMSGACTSGVPSPHHVLDQAAQGRECRTASAAIAFDFEGASTSRCAVRGEREFAILITPEHAPPINPSPWYAFRYRADPGADVTVRLQYLGGSHRYAPILTDGAASRPLDIAVSEDKASATMTLPPGQGMVSAQEVLGLTHFRAAMQRWAAATGKEPEVIGQSHQGRPVEALRMGDPAAPHLVVLLGRQHPPEVTGVIAMEAFVDRLAAMLATDPALGARYQFLVVPMLNPDGVALGHWRANLGGVDLNRDWGAFTQPETSSIKRWLGALPDGVRPVLMLDFHSTYRNLFYVQGDEAGAAGEEFLSRWLGEREGAFPDYPFTIERRNANPGSGTTKNWFNETYGIPAYTYEAADTADRSGTRKAAEALASGLPDALDHYLKVRGY